MNSGVGNKYLLIMKFIFWEGKYTLEKNHSKHMWKAVFILVICLIIEYECNNLGMLGDIWYHMLSIIV